jgi:hypothetical protein
MTGGKAKALTVAAVGTAALFASLEHVAKGRTPPLSTYVGAAVAGVGLLALAEVSPELAAGFAGLLLVGSVLRNGVSAARTVQNALD